MILNIIIGFVTGVLNGLREAQHANLSVFEKAFGARPGGFFGAQSWLNKYKDFPVDTRPRFIGAKSFMAWATDFWHFSNMLKSVLLLALAAWMDFGWLDAVVFFVSYGVASHFSFQIIRQAANGSDKL